MTSVPDFRPERRSGFRRVADAVLSQSGLPFTQLLSAERIERACAEHGNLFGGTVYSTALMVWSFLGQVLRNGKQAPCQAAVARIVVHQQQTGGPAPTADTGDYCRARAKLSEEALHALTVEIGTDVERQARPDWLWKELRAKPVEGLTFTMPDTPANQAEYPQPNSQKRGLRFPVARACTILSLATACILDLALGPYSGKETGETALLRSLLGSFSEGDLLVADRYYCSFLTIALLQQRGVEVCARLHQRRRADFRRGRRLGPDDHLIEWTQPEQPDWLDEETYAQIPETPGLIWQEAELQWLCSFLRAIAQPRLHPLIVLDLPLMDLYANHWSVTGIGVPAADSPDEAVYLPGRNPLLIIKAALWCRLHGIHELALAPLASNPFADAGPEFFADFQAALNCATRGRVQLLRPFERLSKREVMWLGQIYPLSRTFSCIHPYGTLHCGRCNKCQEPREAFRLIGSDDPTEYATTYCGSSPPIDVLR